MSRECPIHGNRRCPYRHWIWQLWRRPYSPSKALHDAAVNGVHDMLQELMNMQDQEQ